MKTKKFHRTADQERALTLLGGPAHGVLLFGGSRSGKTFIIVYALLIRALKAHGSRHAILRLHGNTVRQSILADTLPKVRTLCFPHLNLTEHRTDGLVKLPNGSELWFGGLDRDSRSEKILGREFATIYFNECSELDYAAVVLAMTRLAQRTSLINRAYFDCNPPGKSHWTYQLFIRKIDPATGEAVTFPDNYAALLMNPAGNAANLPPAYLTETLGGLSGRQRARFLEGKFLDDLAGALWRREWIDRARLQTLPVDLRRVVVGVDPAVSSGADADESGIVAAGLGEDGHYYVLGDWSRRGTPLEWARAVGAAYAASRADRIIGEVNNGGDLIELALRSVNADLSYQAVRATRGKYLRAEPVAALYEQRKVHHVGSFPALEEQLCSYVPGRYAGSPDRLDALVWALTDLMAVRAESRMILA
ncbi:phage terminase large subunit [Victivallis sp. Marseille-Q1083]|uniref:phage terminase large subunit n=1 Tax=Victivallis sp. Marseille-Q1083 TaxID=2717288 RepID=UPI001C378657|nr:phage terminase large subunit [Victivallis sp. Marseille-Q1083]